MLDFKVLRNNKNYKDLYDELERMIIKNPQKIRKLLLEETSKGNQKFADFVYVEDIKEKPFDIKKINNVIYECAIKGHTKSILQIMKNYIKTPKESGSFLCQLMKNLLTKDVDDLCSETRMFLAFNVTFGIGCISDPTQADKILKDSDTRDISLEERLLKAFLKEYQKLEIKNSDYKIKFEMPDFDIGDCRSDVKRIYLLSLKDLLEKLLNEEISLVDNLNKKFQLFLNNNANQFLMKNRIRYSKSFYKDLENISELLLTLLEAFEISKYIEDIDFSQICGNTFEIASSMAFEDVSIGISKKERKKLINEFCENSYHRSKDYVESYEKSEKKNKEKKNKEKKNKNKIEINWLKSKLNHTK